MARYLYLLSQSVLVWASCSYPYSDWGTPTVTLIPIQNLTPNFYHINPTKSTHPNVIMDGKNSPAFDETHNDLG